MAVNNSGCGSIFKDWGWQRNGAGLTEESRGLRGIEKFLSRNRPGTNKVLIVPTSA